IKGPFFAERDIVLSSDFLCCDAGYDESLRFETWCCSLYCDCLYLLRRLTMKTSVRLLLRVLYPRVGWPQGVTGWRPPEVLPSPPPCGWSTGFIETPRLEGRIPFQRLRPALPTVTFSWSVLPTWPMVAMHSIRTLRVSPEGSLRSA